MAREFFKVEKGIKITGENSDTAEASLLIGAGNPVGTSGETDDANIGSQYSNLTDGSQWVKTADTSSASDWEELTVGGVALDELSWRNEKVRFATADTLAAGSVNVLTLSDNDDMVYGDIAVGEYVIGDVDGTPALFEVTATPGTPNITIAAAGQALADNDTFVVQQYLPDPTGQEEQAIIHFPLASGPGIKIGDINWEFATGINLSSGYAAANGSVSASDTVESAIQKLDGNQQDIQTASGLSQGDVDYGTFTGATIPDNSTSKGALQALETAYEETDANVDDLITLSGVAENSTDFGSFTGDSLADNQDAKQLYQRIEVLLEQMRGVQATGITAAATVDSVPHASVKAVKWLVEAFEEATPANRKAFEIYAVTDGTNVDDTEYAKLKLGSAFNLVVSVDISGADMRLRVSSSTAGVTVTARRIEVVQSVLQVNNGD